MATPEFFKPMNIQPQTGDMSEVIFRAAQMSLAQKEQQRQAVQGVVDTFLTLAKLNQEKIKEKNDTMIALASLQENKRHHQIMEKTTVLSPDGAQVGEFEGNVKNLPRPTNPGGVSKMNKSVALAGERDSFMRMAEQLLKDMEEISKHTTSNPKDSVPGGIKARVIGLGKEVGASVGANPKLGTAVTNFEAHAATLAKALGNMGNSTEAEQVRSLALGFRARATKEEAVMKIAEFKNMAEKFVNDKNNLIIRVQQGLEIPTKDLDLSFAGDDERQALLDELAGLE